MLDVVSGCYRGISYICPMASSATPCPVMPWAHALFSTSVATAVRSSKTLPESSVLKSGRQS